MYNDIYRCRICGLYHEEPPWGIDGNTPCFEICPCCGVEFGYEDSTRAGIVKYRQNWLDNGCKWFEPLEQPINWDFEKQKQFIPEKYS